MKAPCIQLRRLTLTCAMLVVGSIVCAIGWAWYRDDSQQRQRLREADEKIVTEVEDLLTSRLRSLGEQDAITQRYGKFIKLTNVHWDRPSYTWQLVVRLDWSATAHFEKAQASIYLGIDRGETFAIQRLEMFPTEEFRGERTPVLIEDELWIDHSRCMIDGWATHPAFLYD